MAGDYSIGSDKWAGLSKLIEECGEVMQVVGKLIATDGGTAHWDGSDLRQRLTEELADLWAAVQFVAAANDLATAAFHARVEKKKLQFYEWHREQSHGRCAACGWPNKADGCCSRADCCNSD